MGVLSRVCTERATRLYACRTDRWCRIAEGSGLTLGKLAQQLVKLPSDIFVLPGWGGDVSVVLDNESATASARRAAESGACAFARGDEFDVDMRPLRERGPEGERTIEVLERIGTDPQAFLNSEPPPTGAAAVLARLLHLLRTSDTSLRSLWRAIAGRTDDVMLLAENFQPLFNSTITELCATAGNSPSASRPSGVSDDEWVACNLGPIKDPVRIFQKAADDYQTRFGDGVPGEACVADVLRSRIVCFHAASTCDTIAMIKRPQGFVVEAAQLPGAAEANVVRVKLKTVRIKNKFIDMDPTHFRNALCNLIMVVEWADSLGRPPTAFFCECQVHHRGILQRNEALHAHSHYDFFRTRLANKYDDEMDRMLRETISFLRDSSLVPVRLPMIALLAQTLQTDKNKEIPIKLGELYKIVIEQALEKFYDRREERLKLAEANIKTAEEQLKEANVNPRVDPAQYAKASVDYAKARKEAAAARAEAEADASERWDDGRDAYTASQDLLIALRSIAIINHEKMTMTFSGAEASAQLADETENVRAAWDELTDLAMEACDIVDDKLRVPIIRCSYLPSYGRAIIKEEWNELSRVDKDRVRKQRRVVRDRAVFQFKHSILQDAFVADEIASLHSRWHAWQTDGKLSMFLNSACTGTQPAPPVLHTRMLDSC